jgi:hypothetical protein
MVVFVVLGSIPQRSSRKFQSHRNASIAAANRALVWRAPFGTINLLRWQNFRSQGATATLANYACVSKTQATALYHLSSIDWVWLALVYSNERKRNNCSLEGGNQISLHSIDQIQGTWDALESEMKILNRCCFWMLYHMQSLILDRPSKLSRAEYFKFHHWI